MKIKINMYSLLLVFSWTIVFFSSTEIIGQASSTYEGYHETSWIGNTWGGGSAAGHQQRSNGWVPHDIRDMYVASDGTIYTLAWWEEAHGEATIFDSNGTDLGRLHQTHGSVTDGKDGTSLMVGITVNENNEDNTIYRVSMDGVKRFWGKNQPSIPHRFNTLNWSGKVTPTVKVSPNDSRLRGITFLDNILYCSVEKENRVYPISAFTGEHISGASFSVEKPGKIIADADGNLWILQRTTPMKISKYTSSGTLLLSITDLINPTALALDHSNTNQILIADSGEGRNHVRIYDTNGVLQNTFGRSIFTGESGVVAPNKFDYISGIGRDNTGHYYVAWIGPPNRDGHGTVLRKLTPNGELVWERLGLEFVDSAASDPSDFTNIYTKNERFKMDYTKSNGKEYTFEGYTIDRFKYPNDMRIHERHAYAYKVVRKNGHKFLYCTTMDGFSLGVFRFDGEIAVPAAFFKWKRLEDDWPVILPRNYSIWIDANGDGQINHGEFTDNNTSFFKPQSWTVDDNGDIWVMQENAVLKHFELLSVNQYGVPVYDTTPLVNDLRETTDITYGGRVHYNPETDVMIMGVLTNGETPSYGQAGRLFRRYDNWSSSRDLIWEIDRGNQETKVMDVAGDYVFMANVRTAENGNGVSIYRLSDGEFVTLLRANGEVTHDQLGWIDIKHGLTAFKRTDSEYVLLIEDDWKAKILMYRWFPNNTNNSDDSPPSIPDNLVATAISDNQIDLQWDAATDNVEVISYDIFRDDTFITSVSTTSYSDIGLEQGTLYTYKVRAKDAAGNVSDYSTSISVSTLIPPGSGSLMDTDLGVVGANGAFTESEGVFTLQGAGQDFWGTTDDGYFVYQDFNGNASITARLVSMENTHQWAKSGVMIRESLEAGSKEVSVVFSPNGRISKIWRPQEDASTSISSDLNQSTPNWIRLERNGNTFTGYRSDDGINWIVVHTININMNTSIQIGLAVTSHVHATLNTTIFDNVSVNDVPFGQNVEDSSDRLFLANDIGDVKYPGSYENTNNVLTINGSGRDIWNAADEFYFLHQDLQGDGSIIARITSIEQTHPWAKAGVLIREDLRPESKVIAMTLSPNGKVSYIRRSVVNNRAASTLDESFVAPYWVRLDRINDTFIGYHSSDGITWTEIRRMVVSMNDSVKIGFGVSANGNEELCTAQFDNISITGIGTRNVSENKDITIAQPDDLIKIHPNPSNNGVFYIDTKVHNVTIEVYDIAGKKLLQKDIPKKTSNLVDLEKLSRGIYLVKARSGKQKVAQKIILN